MDPENTPDFVTTILNVGTHFADDEALKALYSAYGSTNIPEEFAIVRNEDGSYDVIRADEVDDPSSVVTEPPFVADEANTPAHAVDAEEEAEEGDEPIIVHWDEDEDEDEEEASSITVKPEALAEASETVALTTEATPRKSENVTSLLESASNIANIKSGDYTITYGETVNINQIDALLPLREYRKETRRGLNNIVKDLGILNPIVVTLTEEYQKYLDAHGFTTAAEADAAGYAGARYKLLDGLRRMSAALTNNIEDVPATIIRFRDPQQASELAIFFSLVLNRQQKHTWAEKWKMLQIIDRSYTVEATVLDWLLDIDLGDSMRLRDVMECEYPEIIDEFVSGKRSLIKSYNSLQKARRDEQNPRAIDDSRSVSDVEEAKDLANDDEQAPLPDEEVQKLLGMGEELISVRDELNTEANLFAGLTDEDRENLENTLLQDELSGLKDEDFLDEGEVVPIFNKPFSQGDDLDDRFPGLGKDVIQDPKNRQPLPPETRAAILMRDGAKCQACGFGEGYKDNIHLGLLECHHITAVYLGGADTASNFVTLCNRCHAAVHIFAGVGGRIYMDKEQFKTVPAAQRRTDAICLHYAKILLRAEAETGKRLRKYKPARNPFWVAQAIAERDVKTVEALTGSAA